MNSIQNKSSQFINQLEEVGVNIKNKENLLNRLKEIDHWRFGFYSLVKNGVRIDIKLKASNSTQNKIYQLLLDYGFNQESSLYCAQEICHND